MLFYSALIFAVVVLATALSIFVSAWISYWHALATAKNAWWMRGDVGRALGMAFLDTVFFLAKILNRSTDMRMAAAASARAAALSASPPLRGSVIFVGSSTFTFWLNLAEDMRAAGVPVQSVNVAFGGSTTRHVLAAADELCIRFAPAVVVYFCGTNDLNLNKSGATANFAAFVARLRASVPAARIVYLAPTITPFVRSRGAASVRRFEDESAQARAFCADTQGCEFVSSAHFQAESGSYLGDGHHLTPAGHRQLAQLLAPAVLRALDVGSGSKHVVSS